MQLRAIAITEQHGDWTRISALYRTAFPENERRPLLPLLLDQTGHGEVLAFYDGPLFCGFACLLTSGDITHVLYFAIEDTLRNRGYGSAALACMAELKNGRRIIVDIEAPTPQAENREQRARRKQFYLRSGFAETPVTYRWRGETYEILSLGGRVTERDFSSFWQRVKTTAPQLLAY